MRTYAPQQVFVDGWVNNPGLVRSDVPLTVSRALAQAGGVKTGAHTDDILVLRRGADGKTLLLSGGARQLCRRRRRRGPAAQIL